MREEADRVWSLTAAEDKSREQERVGFHSTVVTIPCNWNKVNQSDIDTDKLGGRKAKMIFLDEHKANAAAEKSG